MGGFTLEPAERHKELVHKIVKLYFDEPSKPAIAGVLMNVGWNNVFEDE